jgi:hypothetical protein
MTAALRRCREAGYERVGFMLNENAERKADNLWLAAYLMEQRTSGAKPIDPLLVKKWNPEAFARWFRRTQPQVVIGLVHMLEHINRFFKGRTTLAIPPRLLALNVTDNDLEAGWAGVHIDRNEVGAVCVDQVVSMLHRNEKGVPEKPHHLLVESKWAEGNFYPLPRRRRRRSRE